MSQDKQNLHCQDNHTLAIAAEEIQNIDLEEHQWIFGTLIRFQNLALEGMYLDKFAASLKSIPNIHLLKSREGYNLLEHAIRYPNLSLIWTIINNTNLNITKSKLLTNLSPFVLFDVPEEAMLTLVPLEDFELIRTLENRRAPNVRSLLTAGDSYDDSAICALIRMKTSNMAFFKTLVNHSSSILKNKCDVYFDVFKFAVARGIPKTPKLHIIAQALCRQNTTCISDLICNQHPIFPEYKKANSLHLLSVIGGYYRNTLPTTITDTTETLKYLLNNSARQCWGDKNADGFDAYQVAKIHNSTEIINYYRENVLSYEYLAREFIKENLTDNPTWLIIFLSIMAVITATVKISTRFYDRYLFKYRHWSQSPIDQYLNVLSQIVDTQKFKDIPYDGPLTHEFVNNALEHVNTNDNQADVENLRVMYENFPTVKEKPFPVAIQNQKGDFLQQDIIKPNINSLNKNKITFYIPGTASTVERKDIDTTICTHLAYALKSTVVLVHYELAPKKHWPVPLNQVCDTIRNYCKKYSPTSINIAAYSIGGLLSVLAALVLNKEHSISFDRLILFAPALDIGGEFRSKHITENSQSLIRQFLPTRFREKVSRMTVIPKEIKRKDHFNKITKPFEQSVAICFSIFAKKPEILRRFSPTWFHASCFDPKTFPKTTLITGEHDFFIRDTECFFEKLREAGCKANKIILPRANHFIIWRSVYPFYLAQEIKQDNSSHYHGNFGELEKLDKSLRTEEDDLNNPKEIIKRAKALRFFCDNLNKNLIHPNNRKNNEANLRYDSTEPKNNL